MPNPVNDEYETATRQVFYAWAPGNVLGSSELSVSKGHAHDEPHLSAGYALNTGARPIPEGNAAYNQVAVVAGTYAPHPCKLPDRTETMDGVTSRKKPDRARQTRYQAALQYRRLGDPKKQHDGMPRTSMAGAFINFLLGASFLGPESMSALPTTLRSCTNNTRKPALS